MVECLGRLGYGAESRGSNPGLGQLETGKLFKSSRKWYLFRIMVG